MKEQKMNTLENFIITAKANGWVGAKPGGKKTSPSRLGSFDITFSEGDFFYQDSFVGLSDFCGQEHICLNSNPIWSQAYYGHIIRPDLIDGPQVIEILKLALGNLYQEGRFLGGFEFQHRQFKYQDENKGDFKNFQGKEEIFLEDFLVYELLYFGGLVRK